LKKSIRTEQLKNSGKIEDLRDQIFLFKSIAAERTRSRCKEESWTGKDMPIITYLINVKQEVERRMIKCLGMPLHTICLREAPFDSPLNGSQPGRIGALKSLNALH